MSWQELVRYDNAAIHKLSETLKEPYSGNEEQEETQVA